MKRKISPKSLANLNPNRAKDAPGKTIPLLTRVTPEQKAKLLVIANQESISVGTLIRRIIGDYLRGNG